MKKVVVTGGAGTCGSKIIESLLDTNKDTEVVSLDNDEGSLFFQAQKHSAIPNYFASLTDIKDITTLQNVFFGADVVIHCAAYKNVPMCENSPSSCIANNITGTENVIQAAIRNNVKKVLFTSSDKAVNPPNIMGSTKFIGEKLISAAAARAHKESETIFATTRFGNVIGSTGSVLPVFIKLLKSQKKLTLTSKDMTRFMMSQKASTQLVLDTVNRSLGGEVFITKMPVINLELFAKAIFEKCKQIGIVSPSLRFENEVEIIGIRPGEKLYEELMSEEELVRSKELDSFFVLLPDQRQTAKKQANLEAYNSYKKCSRVYNSNVEKALDFEDTFSFLEDTITQDQIDIRQI